MCLPTCARPDGPRCYQVPQEAKQSANASSVDTQCNLPHTPVDFTCKDSSHCHLYLSFPEPPPDDDAAACVLTETEDTQASLRREKSRIAAKLRRQKENQALVRLRLTLPIHTYKVATHSHSHRSGSIHSAKEDANDSELGNQLDSCALYAVPNYRLASSITRQQQIATPEFEKAVTIRLAGNSLCLYNWLYSDERSGDDDRGFRPLTQQPTWSRPALNLFSRSLVLLVMDTAENTVVFAPPSYSQLIGLPWNSIIGLQLPELRARQFAAASAAAAVTSPTCPKSKFVKSFQSHTSSTESLILPGKCSLDSSLPSTLGCNSSSFPSSCLHGKVDTTFGWPSSTSKSYTSLTTLIPPESSTDISVSEESDEVGAVVKSSIGEYSGIHAVCWASCLLPYVSSNRNSRISSVCSLTDSSTLPDRPHNSKSSAYRPSLRVFLFQPMLSPTSKLQHENEQYSFSAIQSSTINPADASDSPHSGLTSASRSYHCWDSLKFAGAQPSFLSALGYDSGRDLDGFTLLDLIHPADLESLAEALNALTPTMPVITMLHRLRSKSGAYRWSRFLGFLVKRDDHEAPSLTRDEELSDSVHGVYRSGESTTSSDQYAYSGALLEDERSRNSSDICNKTSRSNSNSGHSAANPIDQTPSDFWLVCCHQFVHFSKDITSSVCIANHSSVKFNGQLKRFSSVDSTNCIFASVQHDSPQTDKRLKPSFTLQTVRPDHEAWLQKSDPDFIDQTRSHTLSDDDYRPSVVRTSSDYASHDQLCDLQDLECNWKASAEEEGDDGGVALADVEEFSKYNLKTGGLSGLPTYEWQKQAPSIIPDIQHENNILLPLESCRTLLKSRSSIESNAATDVEYLTQTPTYELSSNSQPYSVCSLVPQDEADSSFVEPYLEWSHETATNGPVFNNLDKPGHLLPQAEIFEVPYGYFVRSSEMWSTPFETPIKKRRIDTVSLDSTFQTPPVMEKCSSSSCNTGDRLEMYPSKPQYCFPDTYHRSVGYLTNSYSFRCPYDWQTASVNSECLSTIQHPM